MGSCAGIFDDTSYIASNSATDSNLKSSSSYVATVSGCRQAPNAVDSFRRCWDDIVSYVTKNLAEDEGSSTSNYQSCVLGFCGTRKTSTYLKDIYLMAMYSSNCARKTLAVDPDLPEKLLVEARHRDEVTFEKQIRAVIDRQPVEIGFNHPVEEILTEGLARRQTDVISWIRSILSKTREPNVVSAIVTCLGRVTEDTHPGWAIEIVGHALEHSDISVRDAAVQVLEAWETPEILGLLINHREDIPWLRKYIENIVSHQSID